MEGLGRFVELDSHSALDVDHLKEGTRSFCGTKAEVPRGVPRGVNQGRSRGIDAQSRRSWFPKECINVDHISEDRWRPPLIDADWHAFCQAIYKGIEGRYWWELYEHYKEMSRATGVRKPK